MIRYKLNISKKSFHQLVISISMILLCIAIVMLMACNGGTPLEPLRLKQLKGPLRLCQSNPRYFTDGSSKAIYLTGSHSWNNLQDEGVVGGPLKVFDYPAYLALMQTHKHNYLRMWAYEGYECSDNWTKPANYFDPLPYARTLGQGSTLDGKPKLDVTKFNQAYFDRLRSRIIEAGNRGIYVGIMLFNGWSVDAKCAWPGHPFNASNNINGINGDVSGDKIGREVHTMNASASVIKAQENYVKKVIDTVNDLDNVLYEICNEDYNPANPTAPVAWQYHMVDLIRNYEATKPKQHPIGLTAQGLLDNSWLYSSSADWISPMVFTSPSPGEPWDTNPPLNDGNMKVVLTDTDHLGAKSKNRQWVWKSFTRGHNPIYMDDLTADSNREGIRKSMGYTSAYAAKMNLESMVPHNDLSSTTYCLANPGSEYLIYKPMRRNPLKFIFTVDLKAGTYRYEWFNPSRGIIVSTGLFTVSDGNKFFIPPFFGDAVLYVYNDKHKMN